METLRTLGRRPIRLSIFLGVLVAVGVAPTAQAGASTRSHRPTPAAAKAVTSAVVPGRTQPASKTAVVRPSVAKARPAPSRSAPAPAATLPSSLDRLRGSAFGSPPGAPLAEISCAGAGGLWSSGATWTGGIVPTGADNVTITSGCTVTIDTAAVTFNLTVAGGGVLQYEDTLAQSLTAGGSITVLPGGTFQSNPAGIQTGHVLSAGSHLTNAGTLDFSTNGDTAGAQIIFTGASSAVFANDGTMDLRQTTGVTLNKGTSSASMLEFLPGGTITVQGANTAGFLAIANGTFRVSGSNSFSNPLFGAAVYTIPPTGGIWLNNANATIVGQAGSATNAGLLRLTDGTYNVGTLGTHVMGAGNGASFTVEGGSLNFAGRLTSASTYITYAQSGGAVNVCMAPPCATSPSFGFTGATGVVTKMSGGSINLVNSNGLTTADYNQTGTMVYTGGTLNVGTGATAGNFNFRAQGQAPNVVVDNTANNKTLFVPAQLNVWGNLTINPGTTLNLAGAFTLLQIGPTITNNGAIVATTNNSGTVNFAGSLQALNGGYVQTYTGSGTFGTPALRPGTLSGQNAAGITIDSGVSPLYVNRVNAFYGAIANSDKIQIGNADALALVVQRGATGIPFAAGSLAVAPTYNIGAGGLTLVYAQSQVAMTTGPEIPSTRSVLSLQLLNPTGLTLAGGDLTSTGVANGLLLQSGTLNTIRSQPADHRQHDCRHGRRRLRG